jgi:hypothetical protein
VRWRLRIERHLGRTAPDGADRFSRYDRRHDFDRNEYLHDRDEHNVDRRRDIDRCVVIVVGRCRRHERLLGLVGKLRHRRVVIRLLLERRRQRYRRRGSRHRHLEEQRVRDGYDRVERLGVGQRRRGPQLRVLPAESRRLLDAEHRRRPGPRRVGPSQRRRACTKFGVTVGSVTSVAEYSTPVPV